MVAAEIERVHKPRLERLGITADKVIQELAKTGLANMLDYMTMEDGKLTDPKRGLPITGIQRLRYRPNSSGSLGRFVHGSGE